MRRHESIGRAVDGQMGHRDHNLIAEQLMDEITWRGLIVGREGWNVVKGTKAIGSRVPRVEVKHRPRPAHGRLMRMGDASSSIISMARPC